MKLTPARPLALALLLFCATLSPAAPRYDVIDLGTLPGCFFSRGTDLNDKGQVVGWADTTNHVSRAFLWDRGAMTELRIAGADEALARSINNRGEITGAFVTGGARRNFLWRHNRVHDLGKIDDSPMLGLAFYPNSTHVGNFLAGGAINDRSQVVLRLEGPRGAAIALWENGATIMVETTTRNTTISGFTINIHNEIAGQFLDFNTSPTSSHGFLWRAGEMIDAGTLGGLRAGATRVNDHGIIAGWAAPPGEDLAGVHAYTWKDGKTKDLGTLGGKASRAYGLNNAGDVVGYSHTAENRAAAFLFQNDGDRMLDLNACIDRDSGWSLSSADGINNHGQVLANGRKDGRTRAVLLNPVDFEFALRAPATAVSSEPEARPLAPTPFLPGFSSIEREADGSIRLAIPADDSSADYLVEYSTDLRAWIPLGRPVRQGTRLQFHDPEAAQSPIRFYRVVSASGTER